MGTCDRPGRLVVLALNTLRGELEFETAILDVDLKENDREGEEVPRPESLRLNNEVNLGMFADLEEVLCGGETGEQGALCRMNGMFVNCRHHEVREDVVKEDKEEEKEEEEGQEEETG